MANYLFVAGGLQNAVAPWSMRMYGTSNLSEATVETTWDAAWVALWGNASLAPYIPILTTLTFTYASTMDTNWKQTTKTQTNHALAGTSASKAIGYRTAEVVTLRTPKATRYGRGRVYFPSLATNAVDTTSGYQILPAAMTAFATAFTAFFTALTPNIQLVVLHRRGNLSGTVPPLTFDNVTGSDMANQFYTQRRRGDKVVPTRTTL